MKLTRRRHKHRLKGAHLVHLLFPPPTFEVGHMSAYSFPSLLLLFILLLLLL